MPPDACRAARDRFASLLEPPMDAETLRHAESCVECSRELASLRAVLAAAAELAAGDVPDPGSAYWDRFLPAIRARLEARRGRARLRATKGAGAVAAALLLMAGAAVLAIGLRLPDLPEGSAAGAAGRRLDLALARARTLPRDDRSSIAGLAGLNEEDLLPGISAQEFLDAMADIDRPAGSTCPLDDETLQRLLDGLDQQRAARLRGQIARERG